MAKPDQTSDSENVESRGNPNLSGAGPHGVYYKFAEGHVGQDEESLGDDNRAFDTMYGVLGAKGRNREHIVLGNTSNNPDA